MDLLSLNTLNEHPFVIEAEEARSRVASGLERAEAEAAECRSALEKAEEELARGIASGKVNGAERRLHDLTARMASTERIIGSHQRAEHIAAQAVAEARQRAKSELARLLRERLREATKKFDHALQAARCAEQELRSEIDRSVALVGSSRPSETGWASTLGPSTGTMESRLDRWRVINKEVLAE